MAQIDAELSVEKVTRILKARMARSAFAHVTDMDVRTGTALEVAGLFEKASEERLGDDVKEIILNPLHIRRVITVVGPALFYRDAQNDKQQFALEMKTVLFSPERVVRQAALMHFVSFGDVRPVEGLTKTTREVLRELEVELLSEELSKWQSAALRIHDVLESDILCQIAGARQSVKERYEEGMRFYIPKLLQPSLNAVEALEVAFSRPAEQHAEMISEINLIVDTEINLGSACERYIEKLGTLPLAGMVSFSELIQLWQRRRANGASVWPEVWSWARSGRQIDVYFACLSLLSCPPSADVMNVDEIAKAFSEIFCVRDGDDDGDGANNPSKEIWFWRIFEDLGRHYMRYFETIAPGGRGEPLAISAWWMARRVAEIVCDSAAAAARIQRVALAGAAKNSELGSRFANSHIEKSSASIITHWSPWQLAMISAVNSSSEVVLAALLNETQKSLILSLIIKRTLFWSPIAFGNALNPTYLFELDLFSSLQRWAIICAAGGQHPFLDEMGRLYNEMADPATFALKFGDLANLSESDQLIVANAARLLSLRDALPLDVIWGYLTDAKWRTLTFSKLSLLAFEMIFFSLSSALRLGGDKWIAGLPHIYAQACEESRGDKQRTELIFIFLVMSCIHSYSVSALERLLCGNMRTELLGLAEQWHEKLQYFSRDATPWVAARMRATISAISTAL